MVNDNKSANLEFSDGPRLVDSTETMKHIKDTLNIVYSRDASRRVFQSLTELMDQYAKTKIIRAKRKRYGDRAVLSEKDTMLITYADTIHNRGEKPLLTLYRFLEKHVKDAVSGVHILPFFPSSSDGGYAVINYKEVDPRLGTWQDIQKISQDYRLMVDLVLNHVSSKSRWFTAFLSGDRKYRDYFIWKDKPIEMPKVFRPRENPLLTRFETPAGPKYVWTTFSADQIDLNYKNPEVLLDIIDVMLFYLTQGVELIRVDAVGYVWKEPNTSCVNLSKTHQIVRLLRSVLEYVAPYALIVTEANFPYKDNVAYFGEGHEAHMVYNFSLPPIVVDAFARQDTTYIREMERRTRQDLLFLDFLASHDGIGLLGAREILSEADFANLLGITKSHGGLVSYKATDGGEEPYELNITYFDALNDPACPDDRFAVKRFIASQAVMLFLKGVPDIYIHSLLGSRNYIEGVQETGIKRMINREKLSKESVGRSISSIHSLRYEVFNSFLHLLEVRKRSRAFHPASAREVVLDLDKRLLVTRRQFRDETITVVINVSGDMLPLSQWQGRCDLVTGVEFDGKVEPYGVYLLE